MFRGFVLKVSRFLFYFLNELWFSRRTKRGSQRRPRPLSEGTPRCPQPPTDQPVTQKQEPRWPAAGADAWGGGRDLPSLLQEVSLQGSGRPGWESSEDARQMPRRGVNLFMSLRLKKQGASEGGGQGPQVQEGVRTVLPNVRNKRKRGCFSHAFTL